MNSAEKIEFCNTKQPRCLQERRGFAVVKEKRFTGAWLTAIIAWKTI
jgi:hypothetical protein